MAFYFSDFHVQVGGCRVGYMDKELVTRLLRDCHVALTNAHISTSRRVMVTKLREKKNESRIYGTLLITQL